MGAELRQFGVLNLPPERKSGKLGVGCVDLQQLPFSGVLETQSPGGLRCAGVPEVMDQIGRFQAKLAVSKNASPTLNGLRRLAVHFEDDRPSNT